MPPTFGKSLVWFRRDLRDHDHAALSRALQSSAAVHAVFVFDTTILRALPHDDRRVDFIWHSVQELKSALQARSGDLLVRHGDPRECIVHLARELGVDAVFTNHDYEPAADDRDRAVAEALQRERRGFFTSKDQVIFERTEIVTREGRPYTVFTPYSRRWREALLEQGVQTWPVEPWWDRLAPRHPEPMPSLEQLGFVPSTLDRSLIRPGMSGARHLRDDFAGRMAAYHERRDFPARKGPSYLSVHLRFGTLSIRDAVAMALAQPSDGAHVWLNELIWRDFYAQILANFPHVVHHNFRPEFDTLRWPNPPGHFEAWCEARTGYPLVDAAMRQLSQTGYMHNRLRMLTASFLVKDLLVDWRQGEAWFARQLLDFDLASNNGGWQWAASTGCDAQPWFRIFNPVTQSEKFDGKGQFIRRYVPELARCPDRYIHAPWQMPPLEQQAAGMVIGRDYPAPLVDHAQARKAALALYGRDTPLKESET